jgi:hypothetical protein
MGPNNASSKVDGTPGSDVMAEYTVVSLIALTDSESVGVMPNARSSLANLGLCGFGSSLSNSSSELSSSCSSFSCFSLHLLLGYPRYFPCPLLILYHLGHFDLLVVVVLLVVFL